MVTRFKKIDLFLNSYQRRTRPIQPDGNCFFRAISQALYGQQDNHEEIRNVLVQFVTSNKDVFVKFVPLTAESIDKHLQRMRERYVGYPSGDHCFCQIPIYIDTQRSKTMEYYWEMHNPQSCSSIQHCSLKEHTCSLTHIELMEINPSTPHD